MTKGKKLEKEFFEAVRIGNAASVTNILRNGFNGHLRDREGWTPLHRAAERGNLEILKKLLKEGADLHATNEINGNNALMIASEEGHTEIIQELLKRGADVNAKNDDKKTALYLASNNGKRDAAAELLEGGATIDHDPTTITTCLSILMDDIKSRFRKKRKRELKYKRLIGEAKNILHHQKNKDQDLTLVEYILEEKLLVQREQLINITIELDKELHKDDEVNCEFRVIEVFKIGLESSPELDECIKSIKSKFPLSRGEKIFLIILSFIVNILVGWGFWIADVVTDISFSIHMFDLAATNFTNSTAGCFPGFDDDIDQIINFCRTNFSKDGCLQSLGTALRSGDDCFNNEERFDEPREWWSAGLVSALHVVFPVVTAIIIWAIIEIKSFSRKSILRFPLPPFTKFYTMICDVNLYKNYEDEEKNRKWKNKLEEQSNFVITSMIVEASCESGFQFWFQTIYLMPSLILSFVNVGGGSLTDLFNWRIFSIVSSFGTFAWAFYSIR